MEQGRKDAGFEFLYPCKLSNSQVLMNVAVVGDKGKQSVTLTYDGPFEISISQSQVMPLINADPAGASHIVLDELFPGVKADLIEINEGTGQAIYHLIWDRSGLHYEVLAKGPPLQRRTILEVARSLQ